VINSRETGTFEKSNQYANCEGHAIRVVARRWNQNRQKSWYKYTNKKENILCQLEGYLIAAMQQYSRNAMHLNPKSHFAP
jgi:hypothetical protein